MRSAEVPAPLTHTMHQKGSMGKAIQSEGKTGRVTPAAQRLSPRERMRSFGLFLRYYRKACLGWSCPRATRVGSRRYVLRPALPDHVPHTQSHVCLACSGCRKRGARHAYLPDKGRARFPPYWSIVPKDCAQPNDDAVCHCSLWQWVRRTFTFVDSEVFELQALSWGVDEQAA